MRKIKIITDSTSDLSVDILRKYDITVVPLYVNFGEEIFRDGIDINPEQLFMMVKERGVLPKTAAPSPFDFVKYFKTYIDQEFDIITITISAKMSSAYQNALLATSEFPKGRIWVVDSQNLSTGIGSLVMIAAEMAKEGQSAEKITERLNTIIPRVRVNFIIDTLEYLYKGGRCNVVQHLFGTALRIRPIIGVQQGNMVVENKIRGEKKRALDKIIDKAVNNNSQIDYNRIFITYSRGCEEDVPYVNSYLHEAFPDKEILLTDAGCVISSHCGEGTIGVIHIQK